MKKQNIIKVFLTSIMLSGCNFNFISSQSSSPAGVSSSVNSSSTNENNNNSNSNYYNEVKDLLKDSYNNFTAHDGVSVSIKDSSFYYEQDTTYNNYDGTVEKFNGIVDITNANANIKVDGLKEAESILDMGLSAKFSGNFYMYSLNDYIDSRYEDVMNEDLTSAMYINDGKVYNNLCKFLHEGMYNERYPLKFYQDISSSLEEVETELLASDLVFPLLSSENIETIKSIYKDVTFEDMVGMPEDKFDRIATYVVSDLVSLNKDGNNYVLSLNLTKDNISHKYLSLLDCLYENGLITDGNGNPVTLNDYQEIKKYEKASIAVIGDYINHVKLNVVFDSNFIKSFSADVDIVAKTETQYDDADLGYDAISETTLKTKINLEFGYSDSIKADKPNHSEYVNIDEFLDPENITREINKAATTSNPYSVGEVSYLYDYCLYEYDYDNNLVTVYPGCQDYVDVAIAINSNEPIERIVLEFEYDEETYEEYVVSATYYSSTNSDSFTFGFMDLIYALYGHTYEELVILFGNEDYHESYSDYEEYTWEFEESRLTLTVYICDGVVEGYEYSY